jgi:hypothetical protein
MSNPKITRREVVAFRLQPLTKSAIAALAGKLSVSHGELIETAVARMQTDYEDNQIETIKEARECIREADTRLERLERGQA